MTTNHYENSPPTHSLALQHGDGTNPECGREASNVSTDEVDEVMDSFYLGWVDTPTDRTQSKASTPSSPNSDDGVYDLYNYTVSSTPASESYQSACSSTSSHLFNEEDFEHHLSLAIARYDAKPRRWASYEQDDEPNVGAGLIQGCEVKQDVAAESVLSQLEQRPTRYDSSQTDD